jgi:hypothetical protein
MEFDKPRAAVGFHHRYPAGVLRARGVPRVLKDCGLKTPLAEV